jgi:hypothetical protein
MVTAPFAIGKLAQAGAIRPKRVPLLAFMNLDSAALHGPHAKAQRKNVEPV